MPTPLAHLESIAVPLLRNDVDTDAIIPSREMRTVGKSGLADGLFAGWRYQGVGSRLPESTFVLNRPEYAGARILIAGSNFGCGSSREHAVWALAEYGIRAVLATSFAPIFEANCIRNGLLPARLRGFEIERLAAWAQRPQGPAIVTIDVGSGQVSCEGETLYFAMDAEARDLLITGLNPIELTLGDGGAERIDAWLEADAGERPWIYGGESR